MLPAAATEMPSFGVLWRVVLGAPASPRAASRLFRFGMFLLTLLAVRPGLTDVLRLDVPADRFELLVVLARLRLLFKLFLRFVPVLWGAPVEGALFGGLARRRADGVEVLSPVLAWDRPELFGVRPPASFGASWLGRPWRRFDACARPSRRVDVRVPDDRS